MSYSLREAVFIIDGLRTPVGSYSKSLKDFSVARLGALVIQGLLRRNKIPAESIQEVILGNAVAAGAGQNPARQAVVSAGLPVSIPAFTVNNVCGSGLQAVILAAQAIGCGDKELILAGGMESASQCPHLRFAHFPDDQNSDGEVESLLYDGLWCLLTNRHMGELAEATAKKFRISRRELDEYALNSHLKAVGARESGKFLPEILPIQLAEKKLLDYDERPRKNLNPEKLASLAPAFAEAGITTAGNSSSPGDGAAALMVASEDFVRKNRLKTSARIVGYSFIGVDPKETFQANVPGIRMCLNNCGLSIDDIDLFEICEAFAAQAVLAQKELQIPPEKINVWGGDLALGHPLGASGARILVTLLGALKDRNLRRGLASVCLGGGGAVSMIVERNENPQQNLRMI